MPESGKDFVDSKIIVIEATQAGARGAERHGVYRYLQQLLLDLRALESSHRIRLWFNAFRPFRLNGVQEFLKEVGWDKVEAVVSRIPQTLLQKLKLTVDRFIGPFDLFHGPAHVIPYIRGGKKVVTIHDLAFYQMPESLKEPNPDWCAAIRKRSSNPQADLSGYRARCDFFRRLQRWVPSTLDRVDRIIAVSESTARDLVNFASVPAD